MPEIRKRYDREFREGAVRIVEETRKPIAFDRLRDLSCGATSSCAMWPSSSSTPATANSAGTDATTPPRPAGGTVHDPADEDDQPAADRTGHGSLWERERHARSWWVGADERDTRSAPPTGRRRTGTPPPGPAMPPSIG
jgi:hypothetical protein